MPPTATNADAPAWRAKVLLPLPLAGAYDYRVDQALAPGTLVEVPLGGRKIIGVVWDDAGEGVAVDDSRLKPVERVLPVPGLPDATRRFIDWVAGYTLSPPGAVLRMAISVREAFEPPAPRRGLALAEAAPDPTLASVVGLVPGEARLTPARRRVLEQLRAGAMDPAALSRAAGASRAVIKDMVKRGWLDEVALPAPAPPPLDPRHAVPRLSPAQGEAARRLSATIGAGFGVTLLDGVTGAGKTEVYFEAIAACLAAGRQVLVMLPEIAMSAQWLARFEARFGAPPAEWHSDVPGHRRRATWRRFIAGECPVVVGARSALFLPFKDLGLIVVDEEHDASFKQEDGVIYHARDMAVVRARLGAIPIALVSATPSLETVANVESGRYGVIHLPSRHGGASLPAVSTVDLRRMPPPARGFLSPALRVALAETFAAGEQSLLFLNRRGYAPLTLCRSCGHRLECPSCTAWLVDHRLARRLQCHHCGYSAPPPRTCPSCGGEDAMVACGPGVERVAEEVATLLPAARLDIVTSDSLIGPTSAASFVERMAAGETDIVVGTQLVAKGHHFPRLTLVGVVDADLGLSGGDLRAAERTFQLLHQVAGRAGRAERPGRVLLQTHMPEHPVMAALVAGERDRFLAAESTERRAHGWPPFGRLAAVILAARDPALVDRLARAIARDADPPAGVRLLGPAPAPLAILRGWHRRRFLIKAPRAMAVQPWLSAWLGKRKLPHGVRVGIDIDPTSFL
jgi:primosomal protein N' (replication factor Y)